MPEIINIYEAKTHLSALVERAAAGEEIVIAKAGKPLAKLVPLTPAERVPRKFGQNVLKISYIAPDFDVTPDDILEDFYGPIEPEKRKK